MTFKPTDDQRTAIEIIDRDMGVTAGAGSGKTKVLVERYVHLLEKGFDCHQILAITFTIKAAQEMKQRIRERCQQSGADKELLRRISTAPISTIHSFCQRVLRKHPTAAGIDPRFRVMEDWELQAMRLECAGQVVDSARFLGDIRCWDELFRDYRRPSLLVADLVCIHQYLRSKGKVPLPRTDMDSTGAVLVAKEVLLQTISTLGNDMGVKPTTKQQDRIHKLQELALDLEQTVSIDEEEICQLILEETSGNWFKLKTLIDPVKEAAEAYHQSMLDQAGNNKLTAIAQLIERIDTCCEERKRSAGLLDFDDLEILAEQILWQNHVRQDFAYRHLMVDEFQDTNRRQKKIVDALRRPDTVVFVVGDAKQSIYRFRGAEVEVFIRTQEEIAAAGGQLVSLKDNFRSVPSIVQFTNDWLGQIMDGGPVPYENSIPYRKAGDPAVQVLLADVGEQGSLAEGRIMEASHVASRIRRLVLEEGADYGDIAILFRTMTNVKLYERALAQLAIPFVNLSGRGFYAKQEIQDIFSLIQWLRRPDDRLAMMNVLRSPLLDVSDEGLFWLSRNQPQHLSTADSEKLKQAEALQDNLGSCLSSLPAPQFLERLLQTTEYQQLVLALPYGQQRFANISKLVEKSWQMWAAGRVSLLEQLQYLQLVMEQEAQEEEARLDSELAGAVSIMTVHGAKGLQFPVVFVADMSTQLSRHEQEETVLYHPQSGAGYKHSATHSRIKELLMQESLQEFARLLYVAVTRAENRLFLAATKGSASKKNTWWKWLQEYLQMDPNLPVEEYQARDLYLGSQEPLPRRNWSQGPPLLVQSLAPLEPQYRTVSFFTTALMLYAQCQRCFFIRYVLQFPENRESSALSGKPQKTKAKGLRAISRGNIVHHVCERITHQKQAESLIEWAAVLEGVTLTKKDQADLRRIILGYLESEHFTRVHQNPTWKRELEFAAPLQNWRITGTVDQVWDEPEGLCVLDLKTNQRIDHRSSRNEQYIWQLRIYAWALEQIYQRPVQQASLYYLMQNRIDSYESKELDTAAAEKWLRDACSKIQQARADSIDSFLPGVGCEQCNAVVGKGSEHGVCK